MSRRLVELLENSVTQKIISEIENGTPIEDIDWKKYGLLQSLQFARAGELFLIESLEDNEAADQGEPPT